MLLFAQLLYILLWQIKSIDAILVQVGTPLFMLTSKSFCKLQNPPAIPTLMIAHFVSRVRSCKFIIDWHNFGYRYLCRLKSLFKSLLILHISYSILAINLGEKSLLVKIYKWYA